MEPQTQIPQESQPSASPTTVLQSVPLPQTQQGQPAPEGVANVPMATTAQQPASSAPSKENIYTEICTQIIKEQSRIIGASLALEQAANVEGLTVDATTLHCDITGNGSIVINDLIEKYRDFFGHAAVEVCREAAARFLSNLPSEETPSLLKS